MRMLVHINMSGTIPLFRSPVSITSPICRWAWQVIFRCDLLPWAGMMGVHMLLERQISIGRGLAIGALAAASSLAVTVILDSAFWGRWLWPEFEVLWFNTAENR